MYDQQRHSEYTVMLRVGQRISVHGIATPYELDGPRIEPRGGDIFLIRPDRSWGISNLLHTGYRVFPVGKAACVWR
jgi:hypothetical protein